MGLSTTADYVRIKAENESLKKRLAELVATGQGRPVGAETEEAASADDLGDFVYAVTHDLRSPLVNIRGLAAELRLAIADLEPLAGGLDEISLSAREKALGALHEDVPEILAHIDQCVSRTDRAMNQLVQFSRLAQGELEFSTVDLGKLVHEVVQRLTKEDREGRCEVKIGAVPTLRADAIALETIFSHLISNALKFQVAARPGRIRVTSYLDGGQPCITVADNGRGIAEKDLQRIFAPFRRVGKDTAPGDGMGLAIVRALVRRHRGTITCTSTPDEGSAFCVRLPAEAVAYPRGPA